MTRTTRTARSKALAAVAASALVLGLSACGSDEETAPAAGDESDPIRIGVVNDSDEQWPIFVEKAKAEGIEVELVNFTEYTQPNPALTQGELDLNQFQHLLYLADYNDASGEDLTPIGATAVYPLALYSSQYDSLEDIPEGGEIAIPNDPTNLSRALLVLQDAGLVELEDGGSPFSDETDVLESSRVSVIPVDAAQTAISLPSVAGSIINNDFVEDADLTPEDALYQDDADSEGARPYINIVVARAEDKDNETYLKLVEIFHDAEVEAALQSASGGSAIIADQSAEELQGYLADIVADIQSQG